MPTMLLTHEAGKNLRAFPCSKHAELTIDFLGNSIEGIPGIGPDAGKYLFYLPAGETFWVVFDHEPVDFADSVGIFVTRVLSETEELVYFSHIAGETLRAMPDGASMLDFGSASLVCHEVAPGLYSVLLRRDISLQWFVYRGGWTPAWGSHVGVVGLPPTVGINPPTPPDSMGVIVNLLSVDYEDDWVYLEGIEDLGFEFGPNRSPRGLVAPGSGVKAKRSSPNQTDILFAASAFGVTSETIVFVVWAATVLDRTKDPVVPIDIRSGDILSAFDGRWVIKSVKRNQDHAQWRCICQLSTLEERQ